MTLPKPPGVTRSKLIANVAIGLWGSYKNNSKKENGSLRQRGAPIFLTESVGSWL
jgi:hypothetical protein